MDRERQREIASKGGRAAHAKGTAHEWTADEARSAGRKGGETVSRDREHMAAIGREGGGARSANARARRRIDGNGNGRGDSVVEDMSRVGVAFNGDGEMSTG
jgi:general stress protein YciG